MAVDLGVSGIVPQRTGEQLGHPHGRRLAAAELPEVLFRDAARFGFLLDAFRYGAPPHAGFAFSIELLAGEENIREVIAFPKTQSGLDPLTGAPTPIDLAQLRELSLTVTKIPTKS